MQRELYFKNAMRTKPGNSDYVTPYPLFMVIAADVLDGGCREPQTLSWFDFKGSRAKESFDPVFARYLRKSSCAVSSGDSDSLVSGSYVWIYSGQSRKANDAGGSYGNWLESLVSDLLWREQPIDLTRIEELLHACRLECSPSPVYLAALMLAAADSYDAAERSAEGYMWRDLGLEQAKSLPFFWSRAPEVLMKHTRDALRHALSVGDLLEANALIEEAESIERFRAMESLTALREQLSPSSKKQGANSFEPIYLELFASQPFFTDGGANLSRRLPGNRFKFWIERGEAKYAV